MSTSKDALNPKTLTQDQRKLLAGIVRLRPYAHGNVIDLSFATSLSADFGWTDDYLQGVFTELREAGWLRVISQNTPDLCITPDARTAGIAEIANEKQRAERRRWWESFWGAMFGGIVGVVVSVISAWIIWRLGWNK